MNDNSPEGRQTIPSVQNQFLIVFLLLIPSILCDFRSIAHSEEQDEKGAKDRVEK